LPQTYHRESWSFFRLFPRYARPLPNRKAAMQIKRSFHHEYAPH
jgi:hypothetical protein